MTQTEGRRRRFDAGELGRARLPNLGVPSKRWEDGAAVAAILAEGSRKKMRVSGIPSVNLLYCEAVEALKHLIGSL